MSGVDITLSDVAKRYRTADQEVVALDDVSIGVEAGEVVALMGPSGSGKSTLLHVIGAMDRPDQGQIQVGEVDVSALSRKDRVAYRRSIGFVFQRFHLLAALTVADNVMAPVLPYRVPFDKHARASELAAAVGLGGRERSLPGRLSGGEQQRVAIARALINRPRLLLADEPTGNLDTQTGETIMQLLLGLRSEHGMTMLIATHDPSVAHACDRVIHLRDGRVVDLVAP